MNLLINKKVDLYFQGHDHAYYRSKQLAHRTGCSSVSPGSYDADCVADSGPDGIYTKGGGTVILTSGAGGSPSAAQPERSEKRLLRDVDGQQRQPHVRLPEDHRHRDRDLRPVPPRRRRQLHRHASIK